MARLPAKTEQSSVLELDDLNTKIMAGLMGGKNRYQIARILAKGDDSARIRLRREIKQRLTFDPALATAIGLEAQAIFRENLIPVSRALVGRALRGRPDAIKLIFEASGFHNPKVKHDHSGEIKLTVNIPRPDRDVDITDADVVED